MISIAILDVQGKVLSLDPQFRQLFQDFQTGENLKDVLSDQDAQIFQTQLERANQDGRSEFRIRGLRGQDLFISFFKLEQEMGFGTIVCSETNVDLSFLIHELQSPLMSIKAGLALLKEDVGDSDKLIRLNHQLKRLTEVSHRLAALLLERELSARAS